jgi:isoquinoline 1-oxidoreductase beta subunit
VTEIVNLSRRDLLKAGALAGGGLLLGVFIPRLTRTAFAQEHRDGTFATNAFVRIGTDESVTIVVPHSEMGQGVYTSTAMTVAEELDADWTKVRVESAPVDPAYNHPAFGMQMTGGSTSTWVEWDRLRKAGAAARQMLIAAAADVWKVETGTCTTESSFVLHAGSGRKLSYGQVAEAASHLTPPADVTLKTAKDFRIIGKPTKRLDTPDKTNGKAIFGLDVNLPGMRVAVVARSPFFGGKVKSWNGDKAKAVPGVLQVIPIDWGVAVVAEGFWPAKLGREALEIVWDEGPLATLDSHTQGALYKELAHKPGPVARNDGDVTTALGSAAKKLEAFYELPYLAHAPMEPLNCVADVRDDGAEIWTGTQFQTMDRNAAAKDAGLPPEKVQLHTTLLGGGFGRRAVFDSQFVREAVQLSKAIKAPVKVVWTREDDIRGGHYRPRASHFLRAGLDAAGAPVAWEHRVVCQSFMMGTPFEAFVVKEGVDETAVEGAKELAYEIPNLHVEFQLAPAGATTHFWRSVGHSHTAFAVESFVDELAHAAGKDPFEFRRDLLGKSMRRKRVLETVAEKAGWGKPLPEGQGRGIAVHEAFGSFVAHVAEVSVSKEGKVKVHRFVTAIDVGPVVNPDTLRGQMESAIVFGLTAALHGEITLEKGRVKQRNFHDYPMLRMPEMPVVEVHLVPSEEKMGGAGEPGVPPVAPALCNAIFALTGKRLRRLPIRPEDLRKS